MSRGSLILPPRYLAPAAWYAAVAAADRVTVDTSMRFDKRAKEVHRCVVADTHGPMQLTVPIVKPVSMTRASWADIEISGHGSWWHQHWVTLQSAYGRTPFFEFYADDFRPFYSPDVAGMKLVDYDMALDALVRRLLGITADVVYGAPCAGDKATGDDFSHRPLDFIVEKEYYQVRALTRGFIPGMSVVDLLFNVGPESILLLESMGSGRQSM